MPVEMFQGSRGLLPDSPITVKVGLQSLLLAHDFSFPGVQTKSCCLSTTTSGHLLVNNSDSLPAGLVKIRNAAS